MTVRKTGASYLVDVTMGRDRDGKRVRRKRHCKTKKEAELLDARWNLEKQINKGNASGDMSFADFVDLIYWPQKKNQIRATTEKGYRRDLKLRLLPTFGDMPLNRINRLAIQNMINACPTKKIAQNAKATLSTVLTLATEMEMITTNPATYSYSYPPDIEHEDDHYGVWLSTFAEHTKLLQWLHDSYENEVEERMVVIGLCFGLRKGEILALDWENVDLDNKEIRITQTYTASIGSPILTEPKTKRSRRVVPIPEYALGRMLEWDELEKPEDVGMKGKACHPVICGANGKRMNPKTANDRVTRFREAFYDDGSPVPRITLYSLRHSFATACINAGMEVSKVSAILGHTNTTVTYNRYVKPKLQDIKQDISIIDAAYSCALTG